MIQFKQCFRCLSVLPVDSFYRHPEMRDGRLNKCIECTKADVRKRYALKREDRSEYERMRYQRPERRSALQSYRRAMRMRDPQRDAARNAVSNAVRDGKLKRMPCVSCGSSFRVQAHHRDYSRPLDVEWLCFVCHRECGHGQSVSARVKQAAKESQS